jgi:hypothetical protein
MNRLLLVTALAAVSTACFGQNPEGDITMALSNLSPFYPTTTGANTFAFQVFGTETVGNATSSFETDFFFQAGIDPRSNQAGLVQTELDHFNTTGNTSQHPVHILTKRFVGDGQTFWTYDYQTYRYSAVSYSYRGATAPTGYVVGSDASNLFTHLYSAATGSDAYIGLLMRQTFSGPVFFPVPQYSSWATDYIPEIPDALAGTPDPLDPSAGPYLAGSNEQEVVLYGASGQIGPGGLPRYPAPTRSVAFTLFDPTNTATKWQLSRIHFEDERPGDVLEWNLTANPPDFEAPSYVFEPLSATQMVGWQPILAPGQFNG